MTTKKLWTAPDGRLFEEARVVSICDSPTVVNLASDPYNCDKLQLVLTRHQPESELDFSEVDSSIQNFISALMMYLSGASRTLETKNFLSSHLESVSRAIVKLARSK